MTPPLYNGTTTFILSQLVSHNDLNEYLKGNLDYFKYQIDAVVYLRNTTSTGAVTSGGWRTRGLDQISDPSSIGATLNTTTDQFTLPAGDWIVVGQAMGGSNGSGSQANDHQCRLRNITNGVTEVVGSLSHNNVVSAGFYTNSFLFGRFSVATDPTTFEIQHRLETTPSSDGLGIQTGFDETKVYAHFVFLRLAEISGL